MTSPALPILLVEDDAVLGDLLSRQLVAHGHEVVIATSAESAITKLEDGLHVSLVLLDINLPGDSGWSVLRRGPLTSPNRPPVVVMTAGPVSPTRLHEFGVSGYLPKPFPVETLMDCVARLSGASDDAPTEDNQTAVREEIDA